VCIATDSHRHKPSKDQVELEELDLESVTGKTKSSLSKSNNVILSGITYPLGNIFC